MSPYSLILLFFVAVYQIHNGLIISTVDKWNRMLRNESSV